MAKRKKTKTKPKLKGTLISLGIFFTVLMGIINIVFGSFSWLTVFMPLIVAFVIVFVIELLKSTLKKI